MRFKLSKQDALIIVDMQNDFMPWGSLPVPDADKIIEKVNEVAQIFSLASCPIFASRDWHPENHMAFKENGGIWPKHCVAGTLGADFAKGLKLPPDTFVINKGVNPYHENYSAFQETNLKALLKERGIKRVFICGVAADFCVKETAVGALNLGFFTFLVEDAIKGVFEDKTKKAQEELLSKGAVFLTTDELR